MSLVKFVIMYVDENAGTSSSQAHLQMLHIYAHLHYDSIG